MGETITHETVKDEIHSPVTAVARRVHYILSNVGTEENLLSDYINEARYGIPSRQRKCDTEYAPV